MAGGNMFKTPRSMTRSPMGGLDKRPLARFLNGQQDNIPTPVMSPSAYQVQGLTARSQAANPRAVGGYSNPLAGPGGTNSNFMTPQDRSAFGALAAGASNNAQYGNFGPTAGMEYNASIPTTQAGMANRLANQNPMYAGMQNRFGAQSPLGQRAVQYAADQATVDAGGGAFTQPGGYGSQQVMNPLNQAGGRAFLQNRLAGTTRSAVLNSQGPDNFAMTQPGGGIAGTNRLGALRSALASNPRDEDLQGALRAEESRQTGLRAQAAAKHQQFLADNNGMNANQVRRERELGKKGQARYNRAIMQGMNPMSPQAQAMFPKQTESFMAQRNANRAGGVAKNPMAAAPERTLTGQGVSASRMADQLQNDPALASFGLPPTAGVPELHSALDARMQEDPNLALSDDELKSFQSFAKEADNVSTDQNNQFDFGDSVTGRVTGDLWRELGTLPDNPRSRQDWLNRYKNRTSEAEKQSAKLNADYPPVNPFGRMFDNPPLPKK